MLPWGQARELQLLVKSCGCQTLKNLKRHLRWHRKHFIHVYIYVHCIVSEFWTHSMMLRLKKRLKTKQTKKNAAAGQAGKTLQHKKIWKYVAQCSPTHHDYLCFCIGQVSRYKGCSYVQKLQKAKKSAATLTNGENFVLVKIPHRATGLRLGW